MHSGKHGKKIFTTERIWLPAAAALCVAVIVVAGLVLPRLWRDSVSVEQTTDEIGGTLDSTQTTVVTRPTVVDVLPTFTLQPGDYQVPETILALHVDSDTSEQQAKNLLKRAADMKLNALFVSIPQDGAAFDAAAYLLEKGKKAGLYVYGVLDLGMQDGKWDPALPDERKKALAFVTEAVKKYAAHGWLLTDFSYPDTMKDNTDDYAIVQGNRTRLQLLRDGTTALITQSVKAIKEQNANSFVGLSVSAPMLQSGEAAGYTDVSAWMQQPLMDFVMFKGGQTDFQKNFEAWSALCAQFSMPLYVQHAEGGTAAAQQLTLCRESTVFTGSSFAAKSLPEADSEDENVLYTAMHGKSKPALLFTTPTDRNFTTTSSSVAFLGSANPEYSLTLNGETVTLSADGSFSEDMSLTPGKNQFVFKNGSKTVTYTVTYKITVLREVTPSSPLLLEGGATVEYTAVARKGATVKITMLGTTKQMAVANKQNKDDTAALDADFDTYHATFTMPAGIEGKKRSLGSATITASYSGLTETQKTAAVTLQAKPKAQYRVVVTRDYAETFSGSAVNDLSRPTNAYFIKGTTDVIVGSGSAVGKEYYLLGCGKWVYKTDVEGISGGALSENTVSSVSASVNNNATVFKFDMAWQVPHSVVLLPQKYEAPSAATPNYGLDGVGQTTEYVDIGFYYTKKIPKTVPDVSDSPLLSGAKWTTDSAGNLVLRLYLKQKGQFYGYSVNWDDTVLTFSCKHPDSAADNASNKPLSGIRIVVDPGHGGSASGTYSTIKGLYEKTLTLTYSLALRSKLEALGATVVMTRTSDVSPDNPTMDGRTAFARGGDADLFLSIHMDGSSSAASHGCSVHYFNEYSFAPAQYLINSMRAVEKQHGIGNRAKVLRWNPFFVTRLHDCPAVLIECGFMTNATNMQKLNDINYRNRMVSAITDAVVQYFQSLPVYEDIPEPTTTATTTVLDVTTKATDGSTAASVTKPENGETITENVAATKTKKTTATKTKSTKVSETTTNVRATTANKDAQTTAAKTTVHSVQTTPAKTATTSSTVVTTDQQTTKTTVTETTFETTSDTTVSSENTTHKDAETTTTFDESVETDSVTTTTDGSMDMGGSR